MICGGKELKEESKVKFKVLVKVKVKIKLNSVKFNIQKDL